jgi:excisionase family DNA binding protein
VARPLRAKLHLFAGDLTLRKRPADSSETSAAAPKIQSPLLAAQSDLMTVEELASKLRCHSATIYRLIKQRKIPGFKVGADWRFSNQTIDHWIAEQQPEF